MSPFDLWYRMMLRNVFSSRLLAFGIFGLLMILIPGLAEPAQAWRVGQYWAHQ